jgi:transcriptional regulator with XRE-family HTH domain
MKIHWTNRRDKDFLFRIVADFIIQIEKKMDKDNISQLKLAKKMKITKGRVSQVLNNPGNVSLLTVIKFARTLGMKVSVVAYEDDDPKNTKGPISSEIFQACWERCERPQDFWALEKVLPQALVLRSTLFFYSMEGKPRIYTSKATVGDDTARLIPELQQNPTIQ